MEPRPLSSTLLEFARDPGVYVAGGCCGTTPEHIRQIVELVQPFKQCAVPGLSRTQLLPSRFSRPRRPRPCVRLAWCRNPHPI